MDPIIPPGIEEYLTGTQYNVEVESGSGDWMQFPTVRYFTNAFILDFENKKVSIMTQWPLLYPLYSEKATARVQETWFRTGRVS
jgi:hypothetical protein